ncbi:hypothetical protein RHGRI_037436 [Rhododendron griersonianum]|uniref:LIM zinc-binding domain-containing protein n=1 Tax=Rhododendron griersonianum TaxID=479676 RepID=A0AAV6HRN7_9ERIC|nr:hypothetical protein RHGRI_037436 [Rhododendron griersonianum]
MYLAKDLDEVLAKVTPGALVVDDIDLTKISKPAKKTSRSEGPSSTSSLKRKGTQEVTKLESEETPKKKKRLQKLSEKKTPTEKVAAIAGRTRSSTKTSSPDQAESKETIHHAESTPTTEVKKRKTKTAPIKETQEEKETEKVETEKSPSLVSSDSSPASLEATPEDPPVNPEHEASSQTPEKSRLSPFKPEPPTAQKDEIVEEEAEEDMEDFFKTAASLVQVSLSGISGDGHRSKYGLPPPATTTTPAARWRPPTPAAPPLPATATNTSFWHPDAVHDEAIHESLNLESPPRYGPGNGNGHGRGRGNANGNGNDRGNANGNENGNVSCSGSGSWNGNGNIYQPMSYPYSTGFRVCAGCNTEIGYGRFLNCMNAVWHPECFRCHACNQPICDYEMDYEDTFLAEWSLESLFADIDYYSSLDLIRAWSNEVHFLLLYHGLYLIFIVLDVV